MRLLSTNNLTMNVNSRRFAEITFKNFYTDENIPNLFQNFLKVSFQNVKFDDTINADNAFRNAADVNIDWANTPFPNLVDANSMFNTRTKINISNLNCPNLVNANNFCNANYFTDTYLPSVTAINYVAADYAENLMFPSAAVNVRYLLLKNISNSTFGELTPTQGTGSAVVSLSNVTVLSPVNLCNLFQSCTQLTACDLNATVTGTEAYSAFSGTRITEVPTWINYEIITNAVSMFSGCNYLIANNLNMPNLTNMSGMFLGSYGYGSIPGITIRNFNAPNATGIPVNVNRPANFFDCNMPLWTQYSYRNYNVTKFENCVLGGLTGYANWGFENCHTQFVNTVLPINQANLYNTKNMFGNSWTNYLPKGMNWDTATYIWSPFSGSNIVEFSDIDWSKPQDVSMPFSGAPKCTTIRNILISNFSQGVLVGGAATTTVENVVIENCGGYAGQLFLASGITDFPTTVRINSWKEGVSTLNIYSLCANCYSLVNVTEEGLNNLYGSATFKNAYVVGAFAFCNNLSNSSIKNIVGWVVNTQLVPNGTTAALKNFSQIFKNTPFNNTYYSEYISQLSALGWTTV